MEKIKKAAINAAKPLYKTSPTILGIILLVSIMSFLIPKSAYYSLFSMDPFIDSLIGGAVGSILAGNPITSYVLGGEFLNLGVSLIAVTSFLVAWVTVGIVQLPGESLMLGKKFAILRNVLSFVFSILVAIITITMVGLV